MAKIRILIADDHGVLRAGLKALFRAQPDMEVCGEASDGHEAVHLAGTATPDVVLLDLKMPGLSGTEAVGRIKARSEAKVLVLTMYDDESYLRTVLDAGASGYVLKRAADVELLTAIRAVYAGGVYVDPSLGGAVVKGFLNAAPAGAEATADETPADVLSEREREVLCLLAHGYTSRQIAERLYLSPKTVEGYRARITEKLGLRGRAALTRYAVDKGLLSHD